MGKAKEQKQAAKESRKTIKRVLKYMAKVVWKERPSLYFVYSIMLIAQIIQKTQIVVMPKFLIDELVLVAEGGALSAHLQNVILYAGVICGMNLLAGVLNNVAYQWRDVLAEWFNEYFEVKLAEHVMGMDFEYTEDPKALEQLNRAKEGIGQYSGGVVGILNSVVEMLGSIIVLVGASTIVVLTSPLLLLVQLVALVLIAILNARNNQIQIENHGKVAKVNRVFGYFLFQLADFSYGKEIRLYDSAEMMNQKARSKTDEIVGLWSEMAKKQRFCIWCIDIVNVIRDSFGYFYVGMLALMKKITVGDFSLCVAAASELYSGLRGVVYACQDIVKRCQYADDFLKFQNYPLAFVKGEKEVMGESHTIEFSHVSFRYPRTEQYVLRDVNLRITAGEHLSIVGLNGAGKTTFIKLLCRLYDVTEGEILIDGINIKEYSEDEYRKLFSVVFQDFKLFAFSLRENIAFDKDASDIDINCALKLSGLYEDAKKLPEGLDTVLYKSFDEKGTELSGGQQQKTAIARAMYKNSPIVILDEPTAALDPVAEYDIYKRFDCLVGGKTAIYISHRLSSCKFCDRIVVFADNTIKEYGTHIELMEKKGIYSAMYEAQAQYYIEVM